MTIIPDYNKAVAIQPDRFEKPTGYWAGSDLIVCWACWAQCWLFDWTCSKALGEFLIYIYYTLRDI